MENEEIKWIPNMTVGNSKIDKQHQRLLNQMNGLIKDISIGKDLKIVLNILSFLDKDVKEHLSYEEDYMKKIKYPELENHKKIHEGFVLVYNDYKKEFYLLTKKKGISSEESKKLKEKTRVLANWWINHISTDDKRYAEFASSKKN